MKRLLKGLKEKNNKGLHQFTTVSSDAEADAGEYWSTSTSDSRTRDLSHWAGEGRWSGEERWRKMGESHYGVYQQLKLLSGKARDLGAVLEWGPGRGSNAIRFAGVCKSFYAVDISQANLVETSSQLQKQGFEHYHPCHISPEPPEPCLESVNEPIDFFLSTAVYQHFPSREYGIEITLIASCQLKKRGIALIQTRYDDGTSKSRAKRSNYQKNGVFFTFYPIAVFWKILESEGIRP